jgi:hypothetical protein
MAGNRTGKGKRRTHATAAPLESCEPALRGTGQYPFVDGVCRNLAIYG